MSPATPASLYPNYLGTWSAGNSRIKKNAIISSQSSRYNRSVMMDAKTNILILLMITALLCISGSLVFADQKELDSKVTFTVQ